jgi:hypothetical protein
MGSQHSSLGTQHLTTQGDDAFNAGRYDEAIAHYTDAIAVLGTPSRDVGVIFSNRAAAFHALGRFQSALNDADHCIRVAPNWFVGHYRRALALEALNRLHEAVRSFKTALRHEPTCTEVHERMELTKNRRFAHAFWSLWCQMSSVCLLLVMLTMTVANVVQKGVLAMPAVVSAAVLHAALVGLVVHGRVNGRQALIAATVIGIAVAAYVLWFGSTNIFEIVALVAVVVPLVINAQTTGTVYLAIEGVHFALYISFADEQWCRLDYARVDESNVVAAGFASSMNVVSSTTRRHVTVTNERPVRSSRIHRLGPTNRSRDSIDDHAMEGSGFYGSEYSLLDNNCRKFCSNMCEFLGVHEEYKEKTRSFLCPGH